MSSKNMEMLNDSLKTTSYQLSCVESNMVILDSDESIVSRTALIPINPEEWIYKDGTIRSYICATSYRNNEFLPYIRLSGCPKNLDFLYQAWGLHQFPILNKKESKVVLDVFSELAIHLASKKVYTFVGGWIDDETILLKNILIKLSDIEQVENSSIKKGVNLI